MCERPGRRAEPPTALERHPSWLRRRYERLRDRVDAAERSGLPVVGSVLLTSIAIFLSIVWVMDGLWVTRGARSTDVGKAFVSTPEFGLWLLLLAIQAAVWAASLVPLAAKVLRLLRELRTDTRSRRAAAGLVFTLVLALLLLGVVARVD